jgi:dipeptidyl aminopeptidase/acylaminoacyl peptidase
MLSLYGLALLAAPVRAQQLKTLSLEDYPRWSRVTDVQLAPDGRWMSYGYSPNEGDGTLYIKDLDGTTIHTIARGSTPVFSEDSHWVAYTLNPPGSAGGRGGRGGGGRGGSPPAGRGQPEAAGGGTRTLQLLDLQTGEKYDIPDPQSSVFSKNSKFLAVRRNKANREATNDGTDLVIRNLGDGTVQNIGNVSAFAFNDSGSLLAWTVDAADKAGNGVYVMDPAGGSVRALDTDTLTYDRLAWNEDGTAIAVLRGATPASMEQRSNTLIAFSDLTTKSRASTTLSGTPKRFVYDPSKDAAFPAGMVLSELGTVTWSRDGASLFVGLKEQEDKVETKPGDEHANVEVWHWADERLQSVQKVRMAADQRSTYAAAIPLATGRIVQLADETMPRVDLTRDGRLAIARRDKPYRMLFDEPGGLQDFIAIDVATGNRKTLAERIRFSYGVSPSGRHFVYSKDGTLFLLDVANGTTTDLSALAGIDFTNHDADQPGEKPALGIAGWSKDGRSVLVNAEYDLWSLPLDGHSKAIDLTHGMGAKDAIRFRATNLGETDDDDPGIDTTKPIVLTAYGDWTKKSGYWVVEPGREPRPLIWEDRSIGQARKAKNADRVVFTSQTFVDFPDWYAAPASFASPVRVTDANPQQKEYAWGRRVLIDYTDRRGHKLQATLSLPAGYVEGRRYPMLVYFYEKLSQNHHQYSMPVYDDRPHMSTYASNGYLVLMPDIVYDDGKPGSSAVDDITSATQKVIDLGYADPAHIGAQGHSWGGYESSFLVTQTDMFAAVVTGAPLTNLESMHNILYKQSGGGNAPLIQWGQGRMGTVPWRDPEGYASQSPVRFVEKITTPFMIMQGTADGAVDWNQGLEFYVAARRAGKKVIFLTYPDEPHHLAKKENQKDFQRRMREFFDHYLKGAPAPKWMTDGVPYLDRGREIVADGNGR